MRTRDLIELANDPNFISGIHNYCDRWCERCPFTSRCMVYAMESEEPADSASRDIRNAEFWRGLTSVFQQTKDLLTVWADEHNVELFPSSLDSVAEEKSLRRMDARKHALSSAAEDYAFAVSKWFDEEFTTLETVSDSSEYSDDVDDETENVSDALEVIRWYQFLIAAKMVRAVLAREDEDEANREGARDSDGSIKVALIAIDRSVGAWRLMQQARPELFDSILPFLLRLERLRLSTENEFPDARDFIRAGFDEASLGMIN